MVHQRDIKNVIKKLGPSGSAGWEKGLITLKDTIDRVRGKAGMLTENELASCWMDLAGMPESTIADFLRPSRIFKSMMILKTLAWIEGLEAERAFASVSEKVSTVTRAALSSAMLLAIVGRDKEFLSLLGTLGRFKDVSDVYRKGLKSLESIAGNAPYAEDSSVTPEWFRGMLEDGKVHTRCFLALKVIIEQISKLLVTHPPKALEVKHVMLLVAIRKYNDAVSFVASCRDQTSEIQSGHKWPQFLENLYAIEISLDEMTPSAKSIGQIQEVLSLAAGKRTWDNPLGPLEDLLCQMECKDGYSLKEAWAPGI